MDFAEIIQKNFDKMIGAEINSLNNIIRNGDITFIGKTPLPINCNFYYNPQNGEIVCFKEINGRERYLWMEGFLEKGSLVITPKYKNIKIKVTGFQIKENQTTAQKVIIDSVRKYNKSKKSEVSYIID